MTVGDVKKEIGTIKESGKEIKGNSRKSKELFISIGLYTNKGNLKKQFKRK